MANAVLDGVDGILLGQETLRGCFPVDSVQTCVSIARQAEKVFDHHYHNDHLLESAFAVRGQAARSWCRPVCGRREDSAAPRCRAAITHPTHPPSHGLAAHMLP